MAAGDAAYSFILYEPILYTEKEWAVAAGFVNAETIGVLALGGIQSSSVVPFLLGLRLYGLVLNAVLALSAHLAVMFSRDGSA